MTNYWNHLAQEDNITTEDLFFKIRDLYYRLLVHLYNDPKDIPDFKIWFSMDFDGHSEEQTEYPVAFVTKNSQEIGYSSIRDLSDIENFENSYSRYRDNYFIVFDFKDHTITPLQFITASFFPELIKQIELFGMKRLKISHMLEPLIASGISEFLFGFYQIDFNLLQTLSAMTYEGSYIDCTIIVPRLNSSGKKRVKGNGLDFSFINPVTFSIENLRQIRKLVELSDKYLFLVINNDGKISGVSSEDVRPDECKIRLWGHLSWTLTFDDNQKLSYYNGHYHIHVQKQSNTEHSVDLLSSVIKNADVDQINKIDQLIRLAARQRHGTILIIGNPEDIGKEAKRICGSGNATGISKISLLEQKHLIAYLTSIDGALLMDTDCNCECIGAILDGDMITKGSPARGARFNSTVNYVKRRSQLGQSFIGIVVSEDRSVDLVTDKHVYRLTLSN